MFIADVIDCETGHEYRLNSLILPEGEFRSRLSDLGLIVAGMEPARFKAEQTRYQGSNRGEIHAAVGERPRTAEDVQQMESAALLVPASPLAWNDRHALLQGLAEELTRESERSIDQRKLGLGPVRCLQRALEIEWQWMLEAPEIISDMRAVDRKRGGHGAIPELPIAEALKRILKKQGFNERAAWVAQRVDGYRRGR